MNITAAAISIVSSSKPPDPSYSCSTHLLVPFTRFHGAVGTPLLAHFGLCTRIPFPPLVRFYVPAQFCGSSFHPRKTPKTLPKHSCVDTRLSFSPISQQRTCFFVRNHDLDSAQSCLGRCTRPARA